MRFVIFSPLSPSPCHVSLTHIHGIRLKRGAQTVALCPSHTFPEVALEKAPHRPPPGAVSFASHQRPCLVAIGTSFLHYAVLCPGAAVRVWRALVQRHLQGSGHVPLREAPQGVRGEAERCRGVELGGLVKDAGRGDPDNEWPHVQRCRSDLQPRLLLEE
ncbi:hypothetical protein Q4I30_006685, partial [Leishmania utingensis]